jgi:hypothetical protein
VNLCDPTKQPHLYQTTLASPFSFFPPKKVLVVGERIIPMTKKKLSRLNGSSSGNTRGEAEEAKAESLICAFFYDVDDFVPCEQTHIFARKNFIFPPPLEKVYKVPFLPSFPLSEHFQGYIPSFQWCRIERGREDVHKCVCV